MTIFKHAVLLCHISRFLPKTDLMSMCGTCKELWANLLNIIKWTNRQDETILEYIIIINNLFNNVNRRPILVERVSFFKKRLFVLSQGVRAPREVLKYALDAFVYSEWDLQLSAFPFSPAKELERKKLLDDIINFIHIENFVMDDLSVGGFIHFEVSEIIFPRLGWKWP